MTTDIQFGVRETLEGHYAGQRKSLFNIAVVTALLTTLTFGIYRFWAKTRVRRYIWSSVSDGRDSFEYTGTGLEKLLGFLVAVVILAVYLGVVQMGLYYFGMTLFIEPQTPEQTMMQSMAVVITALAVVPLVFFAKYRVRRYKMARTRWRGIRFGMDKGAWGYAARAMMHWVLTILSLGLLLPWQTLRLERYMTDRSWYGDAPFQQGGKWTALLPMMGHIYMGLAIVVGGGALAGMMALPTEGMMLSGLGFVWFIAGIVLYRVKAFCYLTNSKTLDGNIHFDAQVDTVSLVATVFLGALAAALITGFVFGALGVGIFVLVVPAAMLGQGAMFIATVAVVAAYLLALAITNSLALVWVVQPIIDQVVESITVHNADELQFIEQRSFDEGADAEGFADALDLAAAV
ncbi:DUF898 domain-containing protein [Roseovarius sp. A21]|uniref:DUF898 domain-containing protein n=1 Tax=Roseovarius bejariae TaxID=2576383 RepID=A0A844CRT1_9RHOB|nr:DUF898 family protein [Roseovarius bejariae]MRU14709.1 DUF898 domain-containing protein [Roseovarius bejariae]